MAELEMLRLANAGHVKLIAKLTAERDGWEENAVDTLRQLERVARERDELKRERDAAREERDELISDNYWKSPNY
jgi:hypothetical protein